MMTPQGEEPKERPWFAHKPDCPANLTPATHDAKGKVQEPDLRLCTCDVTPPEPR